MCSLTLWLTFSTDKTSAEAKMRNADSESLVRLCESPDKLTLIRGLILQESLDSEFDQCMQIKLLSILGLLGAGDKTASENMYNVVLDSMKRANASHTIGNAIIIQCIRTITAIYPQPTLLQAGIAPSASPSQGICKSILISAAVLCTGRGSLSTHCSFFSMSSSTKTQKLESDISQ